MGNQASSPGAPFPVGQLGSRVAPARCQQHRRGSSRPPAGARWLERPLEARAGSGRRQGAEEPPQEGGRGSGRACLRAPVQRARVQQAAGAKQQAMGTWSPTLCG